ncbi:alpha/beta fold hydrolase [Amycolatopsis keratiniphila]|uniref:thioesterase II family protein n=1 Tax=Amycolatopsis keratiniphila TaxID=129921 RepID=UPI0034085A0C
MAVLHALAVPASPAAHLVCFPHAGGRADFYSPWLEHLPAYVAMSAAEYPGRGNRGGDPVAAGITALAEEVVAALEPAGRARIPLVLFGHSMGALVAFEVALRLPRPAATVIVSSMPAPRLLRSRAPLPSCEDEVWDHAHSLGGIPDKVHSNRLLRRLTLPVLRADYSLVNRYRYTPGTVIPSPIVACHAVDDPITEAWQMSAWQKLTTAGFELKSFIGGHFYLSSTWRTFTGSLLPALRPSAVPAQRGESSALSPNVTQISESL